MVVSNIKILILILFLLLISSYGAIANEVSEQEQIFQQPSLPLAKQESSTVVLSVDEKVLSLKKLSEHDAVAAQVRLQQLQQAGLGLNQAEYYLLHVIRANIANVRGQEHKVINWLNKAIKLEPYLHEKQLNSPDFADAHLMLADIYQQQGFYQQAFDAKKKYIKKYSAHLKAQNSLRVKRLNEKYQLERKREENELLSQSSELKRFELTRVESQRNQQNINIAFILLAGLLFFFLILRQFKIRRQLKLLARTDSLTQLANRRAFFTTGYHLMAQAISDKSELCVLMIDIDHFKATNDNFGHDIGDRVICLVADLAGEAMRSRDILARIGGEEFAAILPDATVDQARAIAERIREKVQSNSEQKNVSDTVTVSIGLASINDARENFDLLLHAADLAMYQAKKQGRNCVYNYSPTDQE